MKILTIIDNFCDGGNTWGISESSIKFIMM